MNFVTDFVECFVLQFHDKLVKEFKGYLAQHGSDLRNWKDASARTCLMCMILHMSDISSVARPFDIAKLWGALITQGELTCSQAVWKGTCACMHAVSLVVP